MEAPIVIKPIPTQMINELSAYGPVDLKKYIQAPDGSAAQFRAELEDGRALPQGMICTLEGLLTGIPAKNTEGNYDVIVIAENEAGSVQTSFSMIIQIGFTNDATLLDELKAQVWTALKDNMPVPDMDDLYNRPISAVEVYYLLERWGVLMAWDAFNLDPPSNRHELNLDGASEHYHVYDCGSCIIAAPKDLHSHERTMADALQTAKAIAREVYKRSWTVQLAGIERMTRAAWVEIQHLGDKYGKRLEVINFEPKPDDVMAYNKEASVMGRKFEN